MPGEGDSSTASEYRALQEAELANDLLNSFFLPVGTGYDIPPVNGDCANGGDQFAAHLELLARDQTLSEALTFEAWLEREFRSHCEALAADILSNPFAAQIDLLNKQGALD